MKFYLIGLCLFFSLIVQSQTNNEKQNLKYNLNESGSHFFQITFLNQTWLRFNENNAGTLVQNKPQSSSFDIGLRRTRIQMFGQITDKVFVYFQFGQNNFNSQTNSTGNRKLAAFFHDAVTEYKVSKNNELKLGAGLTIANGLSRFSQPSIGSIMTMDVPVFAQATVDQTDNFSRKLSVYARGQIEKFDYRFSLSDPFPITSSGQNLPILSTVSNFAQVGHQLQTQGYLMYQFFDHEPHTTPYMTGTYLGKKKVWNIAVGSIFQKDAMWKKNANNDTLYENMNHFAVESFLDMPLHSSKNDAISAYLGFFKTNYGSNYLRMNGLMNNANGSNLSANNGIVNQGPNFGNALPMFGTGSIVYTQLGYLLPAQNKESLRLMPYVATTLAKFDYLKGLSTNSFNAGINFLIKEHQAKISFDWQNRPTYKIENGSIVNDERKNCFIIQYQIFF